MTTTLEQTLLARSGKQSGVEISFLCPSHEDTRPSASYNSEKDVWQCFTCKASGTGRNLADLLNVNHEGITKHKQEIHVDQEEIKQAIAEHLEEAKKINKVPSALLKHGFTLQDCKDLLIAKEGTTALLPIFDEQNNIVQIKQRFAQSNQRYSYKLKNIGAPAWCSPNALSKQKLLITEGELNAMALWLSLRKTHDDIGVMGIAGCNGQPNTKLLKAKTIYIYADNDEPGQNAKQTWADICLHHAKEVRLLNSLDKDACDIYAESNKEGLAKTYLELIENAKPINQDQVFESQSTSSVNIAIYQQGYATEKERKVDKDTFETYFEQLTNWIFKPFINLEFPDGSKGEKGELIIDGVNKFEIQLKASAWNSRKDLLNQIGDFGALCFTTQNNEIAKIRHYINVTKPQDLPSAIGVTSYGLHYTKGEWYSLYENKPSEALFFAGVPVDPGSKYHAAPQQHSKLKESRQALLELIHLGTRETVLAMLGYAVASAFAPRILRYLNNRLPFAFITGERETGKTTLAEIIANLVTSSRITAHKADGMSDYQYDIAFANQNNLLGLLDEFRPGCINEAQLRKHHDLGQKYRGTGLSGKDFVWNLNRPMIMLGEGFSEDSATLSRGVLYFLRKVDRGSVERYTDFQKLDLNSYAYHLHENALKLTVEQIEALLTYAKNLTEQAKVKSPRQRYALTFIAFGLSWLQLDFVDAGQEAECFSAESIIKTLSKPAQDELEEFGESSEESLTNFEMFLEQLGYALSKQKDIEDYISITGPSAPGSEDYDLLIRKTSCVKLVKDVFKKDAAIHNTRMLTQLSEVDYCHSKDTHKPVHNASTFRGLRIHLDKVPKRCDIEQLRHYAFRLSEKYKIYGS